MAKGVNVQKLNEEVILTVQNATYLDPVQTGVFKGTRAEALVYAIKNALDGEDYTIVPNAQFDNDADLPITVVEIFPAGEGGLITADELALIQKVTDRYRYGWSDMVVLTVQDALTATDRELFYGSRQSVLVYLLTTVLAAGDKFSLAEYVKTVNYGTVLTPILSTTPPNLVTQAQVDLVRIFVM